MDTRPIGVFDSGIGGVTVLKEIRKLLPKENIVYYADTARVPYGPRPAGEIQEFSLEAVNFLLKKDIKLLVIACNTVTAVAFDYIVENVDIPVIGVIEPGVRAVRNTKDIKRLGLIATKATVDSNAYQNRLKSQNDDLIINAKACPMLVSIVEEGWADTEISKLIVERYLENMKKDNIDALILACTHFPVLRNQIEECVEDVRIIDPAEETALELEKVLKAYNILNESETDGEVEFYVSDSAEKFKSIAKNLVEIDRVDEVEIGY